MSGPLAAVDDPPVPFGVVARAVFLQWEKLRLLYLGILIPFTLLVFGASGLLTPAGLVLAVFAGLFANVCYFAGPALETYLRWLGVRGAWPRWLLFAAGTSLTMVLCVGLALGQLLQL